MFEVWGLAVVPAGGQETAESSREGEGERERHQARETITSGAGAPLLPGLRNMPG